MENIVVEVLESVTTWFFSQRWDVVTGPWFEGNKYTLAAITAAYLRFRYKINLKKEQRRL